MKLERDSYHAPAPAYLLYPGDNSYDDLFYPDGATGNAEYLLGTDIRDIQDAGTNPYVEDAPSFDCRQDVTLLVTDGKMVPDLDPGEPDATGKYADYDAGYVPFVKRDRPVHVLDVGAGDASALWMANLAATTGGTYSYVPTATDLAAWTTQPTPTSDESGIERGVDSDGDGLSDYVELHGIVNIAGTGDSHGKRFFTDPHKTDTDDDGIPDGEEVGTPATPVDYGYQADAGHETTAYHLRSDPQEEDGDRDSIADFDEVEAGSSPLEPDSDYDGLDDGEEEVWGTLWDRYDSDNDGFADKYEADNVADGYDPLSYDPPIDYFAWIHEFGIGFFCGDFKICQLDTIPWLMGSVASGFLIFGDVRDTIINFGRGEVLSGVASLVSLIPAAGDAVSVVAKSAKFVARVKDDQRVVTTTLKIVEDAVGIPADVLIVARKIDPDVVKGFEDIGLSPAKIARLFESTPLVRLKRIITDPDIKIIDDVPARSYTNEAGKPVELETPGEFMTGRAGKLYMYKYFDDVGYKQRPLRLPAKGDQPTVGRRYDYVEDNDAAYAAHEIKVGDQSLTARNRLEIAKDIRARELEDTPDDVVWTFLANGQKGVIGPSEPMVHALKDAGIEIRILLP